MGGISGPLLWGGIWLLENSERLAQDEFRRRVKGEWVHMWRERFDDRVRAEGVAVQDYPLLFMDRGYVIFASRDARAPSFLEIVEVWASRGFVYAPDPNVGGWGKFIRTELRKAAHSRARLFEDSKARIKGEKQQLKKSGRGWLHIE